MGEGSQIFLVRCRGAVGQGVLLGVVWMCVCVCVLQIFVRFGGGLSGKVSSEVSSDARMGSRGGGNMLAYNPQSFVSTVCVDTHEIPHSCVYPYLVLFVLICFKYYIAIYVCIYLASEYLYS